MFLFALDVTLEVSFEVGMLSLNTLLSKDYHELTKGLLGNFDGNPDNDFITPDGIQKPPNMTEKEIFEYGQLCKLLSMLSLAFDSGRISSQN